MNQFELYQGIANLAPNGPDDGGLCVLKGSHLMHEKHFADIGGFKAEGDAGEKENGYTLAEGEDEWYKQHGCEAVKICAGKGDLICTSTTSPSLYVSWANAWCSMGFEDGTLERLAGGGADSVRHLRLFLSQVHGIDRNARGQESGL